MKNSAWRIVLSILIVLILSTGFGMIFGLVMPGAWLLTLVIVMFGVYWLSGWVFQSTNSISKAGIWLKIFLPIASLVGYIWGGTSQLRIFYDYYSADKIVEPGVSPTLNDKFQYLFDFQSNIQYMDTLLWVIMIMIVCAGILPFVFLAQKNALNPSKDKKQHRSWKAAWISLGVLILIQIIITSNDQFGGALMLLFTVPLAVLIFVITAISNLQRKK